MPRSRTILSSHSIHVCCLCLYSFSPPTVYTRLEEVLAAVSEKCFEFPPLRAHTHLGLAHLLEAANYETLLASAIVNQIVEVSQSRFLTFKSAAGTSRHSLLGSVGSAYSPSSSLAYQHPPTSAATQQHKSGAGGARRKRGSLSGSYSTVSDMHRSEEDDNSSVPDEEEEEVEVEEDDDDFAQKSEDEAEEFEEDDDEYVKSDEEDKEMEQETEDLEARYGELDFDCERANFPEAGVDLVDSRRFPSIESNLSIDSGIRLVDNTTSWQDNWMFKKHKENRSYHLYHLASDIHYGYMALALDDPMGMLIPKPSLAEPLLVGDRAVDELSDLSEKNSETGSIIFSSDEEPELVGDSGQEEEVEEVAGANLKARPKQLEVFLHGHSAEEEAAAAAAEKTRKRIQRMRAQPRSALLKRWARLKVPDFMAAEQRSSLASRLPDGQAASLEHTPVLVLKPRSAQVHTGIVAQFCCKAAGLMPLAFAWYKDGQLIACSSNVDTAEGTPTETPTPSTKSADIPPARLARIYFGLKFIHRRYVECGTTGYRLIVFNDNECILEVKRTAVSHSGVYSVVAYNHYGYDWADFRVEVDRVHYAASVPPPLPLQSSVIHLPAGPMSPRPVRRRPQNKKKVSLEIGETTTTTSLILFVIPQPEVNELFTQLVNNQKDKQQQQKQPQQQPKTSYTQVSTSSSNSTSASPSPNVVQRTWREREAELVLASKKALANAQQFASFESKVVLRIFRI